MPLLRLLTSIILLLPIMAVASDSFISRLPAKSEIIPDFSRAAVEEYMATQALHHIEGIWMFTDNGVTIAIERYHPENRPYNAAHTGYRIISVTAPNRALRPGTVIGYASPSAKAGIYEARIYTKAIGSTLITPKRFTLKLDNEESRLVFEQHKSPFGLNLWRALPYMWRYTIRQNPKPSPTGGCIRLYPEPQYPLEPRYL